MDLAADVQRSIQPVLGADDDIHRWYFDRAMLIYSARVPRSRAVQIAKVALSEASTQIVTQMVNEASNPSLKPIFAGCCFGGCNGVDYADMLRAWFYNEIPYVPDASAPISCTSNQDDGPCENHRRMTDWARLFQDQMLASPIQMYSVINRMLRESKKIGSANRKVDQIVSVPLTQPWGMVQTQGRGVRSQVHLKRPCFLWFNTFFGYPGNLIMPELAGAYSAGMEPHVVRDRAHPGSRRVIHVNRIPIQQRSVADDPLPGSPGDGLRDFTPEAVRELAA